MSKSIKIVVLFILIALIAIGAYAIYQRNIRNHTVVPAKPPTVVSTMVTEYKTVPIKITGIGNVIATNQISISPKQDGYIKAINFTEGQAVQQNTILITLDDKDIKAQLASDEQLLATKKNVYQHYATAFKQGLVAGMDFATAKADYETALSNVAQDKIKLQNTMLTAPYNGYMGSNDLAVGQYVTAGQKLALLTDRNNLKIEYTVPAQYANQLKMNQPVQVSFENNRQQNLTGKVTFIATDIDSETDTIAVHAEINAPDFAVTPGAFVTVTQTIGNKQTITVPENSIVANLNGYNVFIVKDNKAQSVSIIQGDNSFGNIEITKGLSAGETIIITNAQAIKDGQSIKVVT